MAAMSLEQFSNNYRDTIDRLYSLSNASAWQVSRSSFATALWKSFERRFGAGTSTLTRAEAVRFLDLLHVTDLALAVGCRDGDAGAWRHLVSTYRAPVDAFARAVLGNSSRERDCGFVVGGSLRPSIVQRRPPLAARSIRRPQLADVVDAGSRHPSRGRSMARHAAHG